jgi:hypothetical protein
MLVGIVALVLCIVAVSCEDLGTTTTDLPLTTASTVSPDAVQDARQAIDAISNTRPSGLPDHFIPDEPADIMRTEDDFDFNAYFDVLTRLSVEPGWVIDYFYIYDGMGGYPFVYARPADSAPYASYDEYVAAATAEGQDPEDTSNGDDYLDHIQVEDTREGYWEFTLLRVMGNQFYQFWHAGYNDDTIVCDAETLERILSAADSAFEGNMVPASLWRKARKLDLTPTVRFPDDSTAVVRFVSFSMWGGFTELRYTFSREFPHRLLDTQAVTLIEYDCGVQF